MMPNKDSILPFVSIVMPAFNEEKYIEQSLKAVLGLSYPRESYEIVVVDNGSTDGTVSIAEKYADKVLVIRDVRVGAVRNFGVKNSRGSIIAFLDSDCLPKANWLCASIEYMKEHKCDVVGGIYLLRDNPSWIESAWLINPKPADKPFSNVLVGGAIVIKKEVFIDVGMFNEGINAGEDYALAQTLNEKGFSVHLAAVSAVVHLGYPYTLKSFFFRQFWHASSYLKSKKSGKVDYTFVITFIFLISLVSIPFSIFNVYVLFFCVPVVLLLPLLLTVKRVILAKFITIKLISYLKIYVLDLIYLFGRAAGLLKSILTELKLINDKKTYY